MAENLNSGQPRTNPALEWPEWDSNPGALDLVSLPGPLTSILLNMALVSTVQNGFYLWVCVQKSECGFRIKSSVLTSNLLLIYSTLYHAAQVDSWVCGLKIWSCHHFNESYKKNLDVLSSCGLLCLEFFIRLPHWEWTTYVRGYCKFKKTLSLFQAFR